MREHRPEVMDLLTKTAPDLDGAPDPEQRARDLARILVQPRPRRALLHLAEERRRRVVKWSLFPMHRL